MPEGESKPHSDEPGEGLLVDVPLSRLTEPPRATLYPGGAGEDQRLVAAVLRKDRKAAAEMVALHADAIYGYVRRRLQPAFSAVDDLVQDVFLAAWTHLDKFQGPSLRSWLLGIARHKVEDYYRDRLRKSEIAGEDGTVEDELPDAAPAIDQALDRERANRRTWEILAELNETHRILLVWRYWEHRSTREMAQAAGKTEKAIERMLARARDQFKRRWVHE